VVVLRRWWGCHSGRVSPQSNRDPGQGKSFERVRSGGRFGDAGMAEVSSAG
jgi:hypothetical protein